MLRLNESERLYFILLWQDILGCGFSLVQETKKKVPYIQFLQVCDKCKDFLSLTKLETQLTLVRDGLDCSHFLLLWKGHPSTLFYHLSGDSRISLWERAKRMEGCRERAHRYVLLIKQKMGESPRTWTWIMHVTRGGKGNRELLKYWGEFERKRRDEEERRWGLESARCGVSNRISVLMEVACHSTLVFRLVHTHLWGFLQPLICDSLCIQTLLLWPRTGCDTMGLKMTPSRITQEQDTERDTQTSIHPIIHIYPSFLK